ncbi:MAG: hypothetical protein IGBAC_0823 [Ignavibacteriae bacterium]|nr:MAG: hypothetical protein IGBAC_0823 [Ignavibacteriota bacterium]
MAVKMNWLKIRPYIIYIIVAYLSLFASMLLLGEGDISFDLKGILIVPVIVIPLVYFLKKIKWL